MVASKLLRPALALVAVLLLVAFAVIQVLASTQRELQVAQIREELEHALHDGVATWERELYVRLGDALEDLLEHPEQAADLQARLRRKHPWFSALYVWRPAKPGARSRRGDGDLLFPPSATSEDPRALLAAPCLRPLREVNALALDPSLLARAILTNCRLEPAPIRLYAASEAANLMESVEAWPEALAALRSVALPAELSLGQAAASGIAPFRLAANRTHEARLESLLGRNDLALAQLYQIGLDVVSLDAPDAAPTLQFVEWPILRELEHHGRDDQARRLRALVGLSTRRVAAWREVQEKLVTASPESGPLVSHRLVRDQFSDDPYLLYYGWHADGRRGAALQLEDKPLLREVLAHPALSAFRAHVAIYRGQAFLDGARRGGALALSVPLGQTFPELQIGLRASALTERTSRIEDVFRNLFVVSLVFPFASLIAFVALWAQVQAQQAQLRAAADEARAQEEQRRLLQRQRDFSTRVTHELKTPLAGIKVMAENLEMGAYRDQTHLADLAGRILQEADRLTQRIDEVLALTRERRVPDPRPVDIEEALLDAVEPWEPRYQAANLTLEVDLAPTSPVLGDAQALRDAVSCLLDNALKYRRPDGERGQVALRARQAGRRVQIVVEDDGLGVPVEMREAIFQRFVRVEGPNRGLAGGHGLGLAQVAEIVEQHRGTVRCEASAWGGARFVLDLPAQDAGNGVPG
jgi:signal transduction histidine kinase